MRPTERSVHSLAQKAYGLLKEDILTARIRPGAMVLGTRLAEKYKMSRTPVHEALKLLCKEGLVGVIPRVGYVVSDVTVRDVQEVFQLRLANETLAAELAVDHVTPADLAHFRGMQLRVRREGQRLVKDPAAFRTHAIEANREFHLALARLSGNQRLVDVIGGLLDAGRRTLLLDPEITGYVRQTPVEVDDHAEVVKALEKGDKQGARDAMARHMREGQRRVLGSLLADSAVMTTTLTENVAAAAPRAARRPVRRGLASRK